MQRLEVCFFGLLKKFEWGGEGSAMNAQFGSGQAPDAHVVVGLVMLVGVRPPRKLRTT